MKYNLALLQLDDELFFSTVGDNEIDYCVDHNIGYLYLPDNNTGCMVPTLCCPADRGDDYIQHWVTRMVGIFGIPFTVQDVLFT